VSTSTALAERILTLRKLNGTIALPAMIRLIDSEDLLPHDLLPMAHAQVSTFYAKLAKDAKRVGATSVIVQKSQS
jgi:hypothetical protein